MSLRKRALNAGAWTIASYGAELSSRLLTSLILTRLLVPDSFAMMATAMAIIAGLQLISDFGVTPAIIRSSNGDDAAFLRSAWVFQCSRGILLWLLLAVICSLLALTRAHLGLPATNVFVTPNFPIVTATLGISLVLSGFQSTNLALNMRRLNFRPIALLDLTARIVPIPIMIALAYAYANVWSLVVGALLSSLLRAILSHVILPGPRMGIAWRAEHVREIVDFGKWINVSSIATFIGTQSYVIVLAMLVPSSTLGVFSIAKTLSDAIENFLERLNSTMTLPVLGEIIRANPLDLTSKYYRFRLPIELVAAGFAGFLFSAGDLIIRMLYDERYSAAGLMLQILSFGLLFYPFQLIRGAFTTVGRPNVVAWISILQAVSLAACLAVGYLAYGPLGAIAGIACHRAVPSLATIVMAHREGWISPWKEMRWIPIYAFGYLVGGVSKSILGSFTLIGILHRLK